MPVAEALARVLAGAAPLPAETVPLARGARPRARRRSRGAAHPAAGATSRPWTAMRCAPPTWRRRRRGCAIDRRSAAGHAVRRHGRRRRGGAHLHRRAGAGRRRHGRDPGSTRRATATASSSSAPAAAGPQRPPRRARFPAGRGAACAPAAGSSARDLALAAAMNHPTLAGASPARASRSWRPATSWCRPARTPGPGQIVDSNGFALAALVEQRAAPR